MNVQRTANIHRPFAILAFDWDGTAVENRREDAGPVRRLLERLLDARILLAAITGTNFPNLEGQCLAAVRSAHKENLFVLTNRGSEVYGYPDGEHPTLLWSRVATPAEEELMTRVADTVAAEITSRTGLEIRVVYERLNRRKIDLIPLPEWRDPPKSQIGELAVAVEARLRDAGMAGGIREVFQLTERTARELGLADARITSDVKHIELGLTDKSDSVLWLLREIAAPRGIEPAGIMIAGDEFGPIAGFAGSDAKLIIPEATGAVYLSVGPEPNGVPPEVVHLGGGPPRFRELLGEQIALRAQAWPMTAAAVAPFAPVQPTRDPAWSVVEEGFNLAREHEVESLFTVGNGYLGSRGSLAEGSPLSAPATFIAGIFAYPTAPGAVPGFARGPDWMALSGRVDERELRLTPEDTLVHRRILDLRQGLLWRVWRHEDHAGRRTRIVGVRFASLADRHLLLQLVALTPENYSGAVDLVSRIEAPRETGYTPGDLTVGLEPVAPRTAVDGGGPGAAIGIAAAPPRTLGLRAIGSPDQVAFATAATLVGPAGDTFEVEIESTPTALRESWTGAVRAGATYRLNRYVSIFTTRDLERPDQAATEHLREACAAGAEAALQAHLQAWAERWHYAGLDLQGDDFAAKALHFAAYHLIIAANPEDERVSVGARALTGAAYQGHVFWDTEIFMLPFYTLTHPESARALLMYRYHTLPRAREKAERFGYRGALYPWESAGDGHEATPSFAMAPDGTTVRILCGELEQHISADVAYAAWQYWELTGDDAFLQDAGAEIILETARFWASRGEIEDDGLYHIRHIIGPDEYHEDVDDNAFTNVMAQWNMERGAEVARLLRERWPERWRDLTERLGLDSAEPDEWERLAALMYTGFDPETGLFEQFQGYFGLEEIDISIYEPRTAPLDILIGRERTWGSQVIKQADVVLLILLLWDRFPPEVREANFAYYEPRCAHGSSLSPAIHALVAARLGQHDVARRYFLQGAEIDLANNFGNAALGVHAAGFGGLWQAAILGYAGYLPDPERLRFDPRLPEEWRALGFRLRWRGRTVRVELASGAERGAAQPAVQPAAHPGHSLEIHLEEGEPVPVLLGEGVELLLRQDEPLRASRQGADAEGWRPLGARADESQA